jgi:hypothetical protein
VDNGGPTSADDRAAEPWGNSLRALEAALAHAPARVALRVVVSDHFVRYALVPWSAALVADSDRLNFARLTLRQTYGAAADRWEVCLDAQPAGMPSFACGIDRTLVAALRDAAARHGARLAAVVPLLADRIERNRRALKAKSFCLVSVEPGRLTLAFRAERAWQAVRSRRAEGALVDTLPAALRQEATAGAATANGTLYLIAERAADIAPLAVPGWQIVRLTEPEATVPGSVPLRREPDRALPLTGSEVR